MWVFKYIFIAMKIASLHWLHFVRYRIHLFVPVNGSLGYKPHLQLIHGDYTDARIWDHDERLSKCVNSLRKKVFLIRPSIHHRYVTTNQIILTKGFLKRPDNLCIKNTELFPFEKQQTRDLNTYKDDFK